MVSKYTSYSSNNTITRAENESASSYAKRVLERKIMTLELTPTTMLNEYKIADELELSRKPVHEAILLLRAQLLVNVSPQSGTYVSPICVPLIEQEHYLRSHVEPQVFAEALQAGDTRLTKQLATFLDLRTQAIHNHAWGDLFNADKGFRQLLYTVAGHKLVWHALAACATPMERLMILALREELVSDNVMAISAMGQAMVEGSPQEKDFVAAINKSYETLAATIPVLSERYPGYFASSDNAFSGSTSFLGVSV